MSITKDTTPKGADKEQSSSYRLEALNTDTSSIITDDDRMVEAHGRVADRMEDGYWKSWRFIGSMLAIGLAFAGGTGGFALIAPVLDDINDELGPSPNVLWCLLVYLLLESVFFLLVGRLSDIFGRRW